MIFLIMAMEHRAGAAEDVCADLALEVSNDPVNSVNVSIEPTSVSKLKAAGLAFHLFEVHVHYFVMTIQAVRPREELFTKSALDLFAGSISFFAAVFVTN